MGTLKMNLVAVILQGILACLFYSHAESLDINVDINVETGGSPGTPGTPVTSVSGYCSLKPEGKCNGPRTMDRKKWTFDGKTRMCRSVFGCLSEEKESKFNSFPTLKNCKDAVRNYLSDHDCCNDVDPGNPHEFDKTEGWCIPSIADRTMNNKAQQDGQFGFWWLKKDQPPNGADDRFNERGVLGIYGRK